MTRASPPSLLTWLQKAVARHQAGDLREAERLYDKVLKVDRNNADALNLKGVIASAAGRHKHAIAFLERAAAAQPGSPEPRFNKALALAALGRNAEALAAYEEAIRLKPAYADARLNRGLLLHLMGRREDAIAAFREMTEKCERDARGFYNLGVCLEKSLPGAAPSQRNAIAVDSAAAFERALALDPNNPDIHYAVSNLHTFCGNYRDAAAHLQAALRLRPQWSDAWNNLANQAEALGDREGALALFDRALEQDPANAGAIVNRGMTCLALGRLAEGWEGYARRFDDPRFPFVPRTWPWPKWRGEPLEGKTILVWGDQGVGDELLYASMIQDVAARAGTCVVECEPRLLALYRRSLPGLEIVSGRGAAASQLATRAFDVHCSVLDLGAHLRPRFSAFPNRPGFLRADAATSARLRNQYLADAPRHRLIGISWGSVNPGMGHQKGLPITAFLPLLQLPGATFISLQYGDVREELADLRSRFGVDIREDAEIDPLADLDGFAAQVDACDFVVTISNTTAHFAGALDVPTALYVPDGRKRHWYWFQEGSYSPWYRSIRLFRDPGETGLEAIREALQVAMN